MSWNLPSSKKLKQKPKQRVAARIKADDLCTDVDERSFKCSGHLEIILKSSKPRQCENYLFENVKDILERMAYERSQFQHQAYAILHIGCELGIDPNQTAVTAKISFTDFSVVPRRSKDLKALQSRGKLCSMVSV